MMQLSKPAKMLSQARYLAFIPVAFALTLGFPCEAKPTLLENDTLGQIHLVVDNPPIFPGGDEARIKFLQDNVLYPEEARKRGVQGTVFVQFVIEPDGRVSDVEIVRGIGAGCDEEVVRVVESMPRWIPGRHQGKAVRVQFMMPFRFGLTGRNAPKPATVW